MLIKVLLMLLYYYFINFNSKNIRYNTINIKDKTILNIAQPEILKDEKINDLLFTITIEDININNKPIYKINSKENNVNKNITILKESNKDIIFLAAHSGYGSIAYFNNLDKLKINSKVNINYNNTNYTYKVINSYEVDKGNITVHKRNEKQLILTTCGKKDNTQLIVETILE